MNVHTKWNCFITIRDDIIVSQRLPWKRGGANISGAWLTANVRVRRAGRAHCARYIKFSHVRKSKFLSDSDSEPVFFCYDSNNSDMNTWYFYSCVNLQLKALGMSTMPSVIV